MDMLGDKLIVLRTYMVNIETEKGMLKEEDCSNIAIKRN